VNYGERLEKIRRVMADDGIAMVMFEDCEARRDTTIRWLCGQPSDALFFVSADATLLVPWDVIMAGSFATADAVVPYNDFDRSPVKALRCAAERLGVAPWSKIEIPAATPFPDFENFGRELPEFKPVCRAKGVGEAALFLRSLKDDGEISVIRRAADATNRVIALLEEGVRSGGIATEADAAMLIELESRRLGCEGTGFQTLAAGPSRSFGIHAFPSWTAGPFAGEGLSILDFGLTLEGYNTDVTLTFVRNAGERQRRMVELVEEAAALAAAALKPGADVAETARAVNAFFEAAGFGAMVHGLGHGLGLDVHECPSLRARGPAWKLRPGMVVAVEPALYDSALGGCRLENDYLITEDGCEVLTRSRVVRV